MTNTAGHHPRYRYNRIQKAREMERIFYVNIDIEFACFLLVSWWFTWQAGLVQPAHLKTSRGLHENELALEVSFPDGNCKSSGATSAFTTCAWSANAGVAIVAGKSEEMACGLWIKRGCVLPTLTLKLDDKRGVHGGRRPLILEQMRLMLGSKPWARREFLAGIHAMLWTCPSWQIVSELIKQVTHDCEEFVTWLASEALS